MTAGALAVGFNILYFVSFMLLKAHKFADVMIYCETWIKKIGILIRLVIRNFCSFNFLAEIDIELLN